MKVAMIIAYDGSKFCGSQTQPNGFGVANKIKSKFTILGVHSDLIFSGRTDAGVHATGQCVSFELPNYWLDLELFKQRANTLLLPDIFIKHIHEVDSSFHARFSAKKRVYRYVISTNDFSVFASNYQLTIDSLNETLLKDAIKLFIGTYDFEYFSKKGSEPKSTIRTIYDAKIYSPKKNLYILYFEGNSFLRSQIRMMVWFLIQISKGKQTTDNLVKQLVKKKIYEKNLAPSNGLYLAKIKY